MPGPGSLTVTELPARDSRGRRVAVQRITGSGPVRAGDAYLVLVDVPRTLANGRRMVDVVTAGILECVTPSRGQTRGTWTMRRDGAEDKTAQTTRDAAALALAGWVPTAEEAAALAEAAELSAAVARGDRDALDRVNAAADQLRAPAVDVADLAARYVDALARAAGWEHVGAAREEHAARLEADRIAAQLDAAGACPCQLPREHPRGLEFCREHGAGLADVEPEPAGPIPGSFHDPRATCCGRDAADCGCDPVAAELVALADQLQAARELEEAAEARHATADAAVLAARAALEAAEEERRQAREAMAAAHAAADALWT